MDDRIPARSAERGSNRGMVSINGHAPFLQALADEGQRERFVHDYVAGLRQEFHPRPDGRVLFPFRCFSWLLKNERRASDKLPIEWILDDYTVLNLPCNELASHELVNQTCQPRLLGESVAMPVRAT